MCPHFRFETVGTTRARTSIYRRKRLHAQRRELPCAEAGGKILSILTRNACESNNSMLPLGSLIQYPKHTRYSRTRWGTHLGIKAKGPLQRAAGRKVRLPGPPLCRRPTPPVRAAVQITLQPAPAALSENALRWGPERGRGGGRERGRGIKRAVVAAACRRGRCMSSRQRGQRGAEGLAWPTRQLGVRIGPHANGGRAGELRSACSRTGRDGRRHARPGWPAASARPRSAPTDRGRSGGGGRPPAGQKSCILAGCRGQQPSATRERAQSQGRQWQCFQYDQVRPCASRGGEITHRSPRFTGQQKALNLDAPPFDGPISTASVRRLGPRLPAT